MQPDLFRIGASEPARRHRASARALRHRPLLGRPPPPDGVRDHHERRKHSSTTMDYGPAPEAPSEAQRLARRARGGASGISSAASASRPPAARALRCRSTRRTASASRASRKAPRRTSTPPSRRRARRSPAGRRSPATARARHLYALARMCRSRRALFAVLETIDNGKPIRETRDIDIPLVARHFYHHAGWAQLIDSEFAGYAPVGVFGQIIPWNFPLLMLAWKIAPALAAGQHGGAEAGGIHAADRARLRRDLPRDRAAARRRQHRHRRRRDRRSARRASRRRQDRLHRLDRGRPAHPQGDRRQRARSCRSSSAASRRSSCSRTPTSTARSKAWSTRSGSTRARSAAPARGCWCRKASPRRFIAKLTRAHGERCAWAIRSTSRSTSARSSRRCSSSDPGAGRERRGARARRMWQPTGALPDRGLLLSRRRWSPTSHPRHRSRGRGDLRPGAGRDDLPHAGRGGALANNTRYGLAASVWSENINLALDVAPQASRPAWSGSTRPTVRRRRRLRRLPRDRLRPRGRPRRLSRIPQADEPGAGAKRGAKARAVIARRL